MQFPVSTWEECDAVVEAAHEASVQMRGWPGDRFARYLEAFAKRVEARAEELITTANLVAQKRRSAEVEKEDIRKVYNLFVDVKRSTEFLRDYE